MAAPNGPNQLVTRVINDLIAFSGETEADGYMVFFKQQQISNLRGFINRMHEEAKTARNEIGQITALIAEMEASGAEEHHDHLIDLRADREATRTKLEGLEALIMDAGEQVEIKEEEVEQLNG
ncbi:hypothetical protein CTI12_AA341340 [Artemisia annua]|uniref:Uncharacterized protein n=1 Tax=Artemisia annua TaxID=35608 RepID=A0A2U1MUS6_ARTAN|nr:hypothetical protein CTI12_AA341340 [Artemisia annua]